MVDVVEVHDIDEVEDVVLVHVAKDAGRNVPKCVEMC
jgi:hypothetical protein